MSAIKYPATLMVILSIIALIAQIISVYVGPIEYTGQLGYAYSQGENPITSINFNFQEEIGDSLLILSVPSEWAWQLGGNTLSLSGGALSPGESVIIEVSLKRYLVPGGRPFTAVGTTSLGESSTTEGVLEITETILLKILWILADNQMTVLGATAVILLAEAFLIIRARPRIVQDDPGVRVATGPEDEALMPPPLISVGSTRCANSYGWRHIRSTIKIIPEGETTTFTDDLLPMRFAGSDEHMLLHMCTCPATGKVSTQKINVNASVGIE